MVRKKIEMKMRRLRQLEIMRMVVVTPRSLRPKRMTKTATKKKLNFKKKKKKAALACSLSTSRRNLQVATFP